MKSLNESIAIYQKALRQGDILAAYRELVKFVMRIRTELINEKFDDYAIAGIAHGYLDYTYFYYSNQFLKAQKLKLAFVLNHVEMRFEIWLIGNTQAVQQNFWQILKNTPWACGRNEKPEYAIIESVISDQLDFENPDNLANLVKQSTKTISKQIETFLKSNHF